VDHRHNSLLEYIKVSLTGPTRPRESYGYLTLVINHTLFRVAFILLQRHFLSFIWLKDHCLNTEMPDTTSEVIVRNYNFGM
jgi:hypothetical protein